ncbi:MAG: ComF family protein [Magnetococcales bacterium]|nr:ComF family protein [Magnetococcales bacterium]
MDGIPLPRIPTVWFDRAGRGRDDLLDFLFPPLCPLCHTRVSQEHHLCPSCLEALPPQPENHCLRCGGQTDRPEPSCIQCRENPWTADASYFVFPYQGAVVELILGLKFADRSEYSVLLGRLIWERLGAAIRWESPELVLPMPLHPWRLIGRRYNQSALLARELARRLDRPLATNLLFRHKRTQPQTRLNAQARRHNVQGAFRVREEQGVKGRSLLLVDDVMTTGATIRAASAVLKQAGAARVIILCVARVDL